MRNKTEENIEKLHCIFVGFVFFGQNITTCLDKQEITKYFVLLPSQWKIFFPGLNANLHPRKCTVHSHKLQPEYSFVCNWGGHRCWHHYPAQSLSEMAGMSSTNFRIINNCLLQTESCFMIFVALWENNVYLNTERDSHKNCLYFVKGCVGCSLQTGFNIFLNTSEGLSSRCFS